jgi:protein-L-isoaspartate(D-aspartate) O-methyltransferase
LIVYRPDTELASHYFEAILKDQFDAVIFIDQTTYLRPLDSDEYVAQPSEAVWPSPAPTQ